MGTIVINPFNSDQVLFTTGYGIWCCTNATAADAGKPTQWVFLDQGLEETVPLALISPPAGAHLISGVGDIDGFRHDTMDVSPVEGTFAGPRLSSTRDLAFAANKPEVMVRIGNGGRDLSAHAILSEDGGRTWEALASDPPGREWWTRQDCLERRRQDHCLGIAARFGQLYDEPWSNLDQLRGTFLRDQCRCRSGQC